MKFTRLIIFCCLFGFFQQANAQDANQKAVAKNTAEITNFIDLNEKKFPTRKEAGKKELTGTFVFVVEADGSIKDVTVKDSLGFGLDEMVVQMMTSSNDWQPIIINGVATPVRFSLPLRIKLPKKQKTN